MSNSAKGKPIRVVQISDPHLYAQREGQLLGLNTEFSFTEVLKIVQKEQLNPDLFLATGDLAQDGSEVAYSRFQEFMKPFNKPVYWLPGNHDVVPNMRAAIDDVANMSPCNIDVGNWRIIMLDSSIPGEVSGRVSPEQLEFLENSLTGSKDKYAMVCLHHHPIPYESEWLDSGALLNPDELFAVLDKFTHVRALVWGHVHQVCEVERNGVNLYSLPSTCVQFKPKCKEFALDEKNPGYRWFDLHDDGTIDSEVSRVVGVKFEVDFSIKGY